jgi:type II secretory pathway pseudopilin PulG
MNRSRLHSFTLVEVMIATAITGIVGLMLWSVFYTGTVLGAKNTAINTAHQQARVAMLNMLQDIHSAISLPQLTDASGTPYSTPPPSGFAEGISFQQWSSGPHNIIQDAPLGQNYIVLNLVTANGNPNPVAGQHLIIPSHQIEADIVSVSGPQNAFVVTLGNIYGPNLLPGQVAAAVAAGVTPVSGGSLIYPVVDHPDHGYPVTSLPITISGTGSTAGDVICFVTNRCSYTVSNNTLSWTRQGTTRVASSDITNATPFSIPTTDAGAAYHRFVAAIDLSTSDAHYSNRGYKAANILLNGQVPQKARLTTYQ